MIKFVKKIYNNILPLTLRTKINKIKYPYEIRALRKKIFSYYSKIPYEDLNSEQNDVLIYLQDNEVCNFPGDYNLKYTPEGVIVFTDEQLGLNYVIFNDNRLYFRRSSTPEMVKTEFCNLLVEQDKDSPHCYLSNDFFLEPESVVADIGTAEGIFSLSAVETASKIYLFEPDFEWIEALKATFSPWKEKITIVNKYVSDHNDHNCISLDHFFKDKESVNFLKIDVDGDEARVLSGGNQFINDQKNLKIALCTYHNQNDEHVFAELLLKKGFEISFSKGYMIFFNNGFDINPPYLRRGIVRAQKLAAK